MAVSPAKTGGARTREALAAVALCTVVAVVYALGARRAYAFDDDASHYLGLAESLLEGRGYRFDGSVHTRFPPATSVAYLPVLAAVGRDFAWIYRWTIAMSVAALLVVWAWARERHERRPLGLVLACAASATWFEYSTGASLSEAPYALFCFLGLWAVERALNGAARWRWLAAWCVPAAFLTRSLGLSYLGAFALAWLCRSTARRNGRGVVALASVTGLVVVAVWCVWISSARHPVLAAEFGHAPNYVEQLTAHDPHHPDLGRVTLASLGARVTSHALAQARHVTEIATNAPWLPPRAVAPWTLAVLLVLGLGVRAEIRRRNPIAGFWLACTFVMLTLWPYDEDRRFVMPIVPVILLLAWHGVRTVVVEFRRRTARALRLTLFAALAGFAWTRLDLVQRVTPEGSIERLGRWSWIVVAAASALLLVNGVRSVRWFRSLNARRVAWVWAVIFATLGLSAVPQVLAENGEPWRQAPAREASRWLAAHVPIDAVVMATDFGPIHFATGRKTVPFPVTKNGAQLVRAIVESQPDWLVVVEPRANEYLRPDDVTRLAVLERELPDVLQAVHRAEGVRILRIDHQRVSASAAR